MSRSRKKKPASAGKRKQEEIQRRIEKAAENAEKKKSQAPAGQPAEKKPEQPAAVDTKTENRVAKKPAPKPKPRQERVRTESPFAPARKVLAISDDGDVSFPARIGLADLFKAIRNDFPSGEAFLYINLDPGTTARNSYSLSYIYHNGLFNRKEAIDGKTIPKDAPLLADILDARIAGVSVDLDGDWAEWYVDARPATA